MSKNAYVPELGDLVKHKVTGQKGIVVTMTKHLHGCNTITFQPQEVKDGKPVDAVWADENAVELVKPAVVKPAERYQPRQNDGCSMHIDRPRAIGRPVDPRRR